MKKHYFDLFRLWLREYFKHPLENIRQANPIVPGRLYRNFGNVCKAVPLTRQEQALIREMKVTDHGEIVPSHTPEALMELARSAHGNHRMVKEYQALFDKEDNVPPRCLFCDFHRMGIPCPIHNILANGSTVCDSHKYIIIKPVSHV